MCAVCALLAFALVAGGAVEHAVPGLRTWFFEHGCTF
jgi:hypothetical protein